MKDLWYSIPQDDFSSLHARLACLDFANNWRKTIWWLISRRLAWWKHCFPKSSFKGYTEVGQHIQEISSEEWKELGRPFSETLFLEWGDVWWVMSQRRKLTRAWIGVHYCIVTTVNRDKGGRGITSILLRSWPYVSPIREWGLFFFSNSKW